MIVGATEATGATTGAGWTTGPTGTTGVAGTSNADGGKAVFGKIIWDVIGLASGGIVVIGFNMAGFTIAEGAKAGATTAGAVNPTGATGKGDVVGKLIFRAEFSTGVFSGNVSPVCATAG